MRNKPGDRDVRHLVDDDEQSTVPPIVRIGRSQKSVV